MKNHVSTWWRLHAVNVWEILYLKKKLHSKKSMGVTRQQRKKKVVPWNEQGTIAVNPRCVEIKLLIQNFNPVHPNLYTTIFFYFCETKFLWATKFVLEVNINVVWTIQVYTQKYIIFLYSHVRTTSFTHYIQNTCVQNINAYTGRRRD